MPNGQYWVFKQSQLIPKNVFGASTGFEPMAPALALQQQSYEGRPTRWEQAIRELKIYEATEAKRSLKIASSSFSIYFATMSVCLTFES